MKTQTEVLKCIAKAVKNLDSMGFANQSMEDKVKIQSARAKLVNVLFANGYELQYGTYRMIKSKISRELLIETI